MSSQSQNDEPGVCAVEIGNLRFVKKSGNAGRKEQPFMSTFVFTGGAVAVRARSSKGRVGLQTLTCDVTTLRRGNPVNVNVHVNVNEGFSCYRADSWPSSKASRVLAALLRIG